MIGIVTLNEDVKTIRVVAIPRLDNLPDNWLINLNQNRLRSA